MKSNKDLINDITLYKNLQKSLCVRGTVIVNRYSHIDFWYAVDSNYPVVDPQEDCDKLCPRCADPNVESRRGYETCICIHAEMVSLLRDFNPGYMVVNRYPCMACLIAIVHDQRIGELIIVVDRDEAVDEDLLQAMDIVISRANMTIRVIDIREGDEKVSILREAGQREDNTIKSDESVLWGEGIVTSPFPPVGGGTIPADSDIIVGTGTGEIQIQGTVTIPRIDEEINGPVVLDHEVGGRIQTIYGIRDKDIFRR